MNQRASLLLFVSIGVTNPSFPLKDSPAARRSPQFTRVANNMRLMSLFVVANKGIFGLG